MMTSTHLVTKIDCLYGDVFKSLDRIYALCIAYLFTDIITHANNFKSYFNQTKLNLDIVPDFSNNISQFSILKVTVCCKIVCNEVF